MRIIGNAGKAREVQAVASGALPSGQPVVVNSDGTVSVVEETSGFSVLGSTFSPSTGTGSNPIIQFDPTDGSKFVYVYRDGANSNYGTAVIGQVSGSAITFGTPVVFLTSYFASGNEAVGYSADGTKVVINIRDYGNSNYGSIIAASVSGTTLTFGSASVYQSNTTYSPTLSCDPFDSTKFVFTYRNQASGSIGQARVGTLSGTSVSRGSAVTFNNATTYNTAIAHNPNEQNKFIVVWNDTTKFSGSIGTVSGTSISFGSETTIASNQVSEVGISFDPSSTSDKAVAVMEDTTNDKGKVVVCSISGSTITVGSTVEFYSNQPGYVGIAFSKVNDNQFYVGYWSTPSPNLARCVVGTLSGTTCSFANDTPVNSGDSFYTTVATSVSGEILFGYRDNDSTTRGVIAVCSDESTNLTSDNYIGMSGGAVTVTPQELGTATVFESGTSQHMSAAYDTNSNRVVVAYQDASNSSRGTAVVGTVTGTSISFGAPVVFETGTTNAISAVFDNNTNKIVISYQDSGNSGYGTSVVGTVSGTSISFGTPVVFESASSSYVTSSYDSSSQKVVISYSDIGNSRYGTAVVGTVSGTSISFGSPVIFESGARVDDIGCTYDSANQKVIVGYGKGYATGEAVVGTVSGTSISFGTPVQFYSGNTTFFYTSLAYDSNTQKVVIAYSDYANSSHGTAIVGDISGTSISFGSAVVFEAANTSYISSSYNEAANSVVITYTDAGNSNYGTASIGTVSGTSISFETPLVVNNNTSYFSSAVYDEGAEKTVISYRDDGNSSSGTAKVLQVGATTRGEVASGGNATIGIKGNVSTNQVGLTAGQSYYVQTDGTLGTTPADPSVFAGTAVAANKLIVKG